MSDQYRQLLDATIQHLEGLKARGVRHVAVAPESLRALTLSLAKLPIADCRLPIEKSPGRPVPAAKTEPTIFMPPKKNTAPVQSEISAPPVFQSAIRNPQSAIEWRYFQQRIA